MKILNDKGNMKTISNGEDVFLAVNTGLNKKAFSRLNKTGTKYFPGYLWDGSELKVVDFKSIFNIDEKVYLYGDYFNIIPVLDYINKSNDLGIIKKLAGMFMALEGKGVELDSLTAETIFVNEDLEIVIFPEFLAELMSCRGSGKDQIVKFDVYNHPDHSGARKIVFFLGVILYKGLSQSFPFYDNRKDFLKQKMRSSYFLALNGIDSELSPEIVKLISNSMTGKIDSLSEFSNILNCIENSRTFSPEAKAVFDNRQFLYNKKVQRRIFIRNNIFKFAGAILFTCLLVFSFYISSKKELEPQITYGFSQEKVIQSYFDSFNSLDVSLNMNCVSGNVKRKDSDEILVQAISNGALEMDGLLGVLNPEEWTSLENKDAAIYGVSDVIVKKIGDNSFKVNYTKWITESKHGESVLDSYYVVIRADLEEVYQMKMIDGVWKIDNIEVVNEVEKTL